jgi:D-arabinose 1-dehydrogenase-like Zn-dependent alcohol dehydrogenase
MKAIFYREFGDRNVLTYGDMPDPHPGAGELLLKTARTSVNFVDIRERQGIYNKPETHGGKTYLPHTPGLQAGSTGGSFAQSVGDAALARIASAASAEPCSGIVNKDSSQSCATCGLINFSPYQTCSGQPVSYCH